jgi:hypothetical protein
LGRVARQFVAVFCHKPRKKLAILRVVVAGRGPRAGAAAVSQKVARCVEIVARVTRDEEHGRNRRCAACDRRATECGGHVARDREILGMQHPTVHPDAPGVSVTRRSNGLTHGAAAENGAFDHQRGRAGGEIDVQPAFEHGLVVDNGLLRQPGEIAAGRDVDPGMDARVVVARPVGLLAGLGGEYG